MSDPSSKPPSIPSWQRQSESGPADPSPSSPSASPNSDDLPASTLRHDLLEQASRFLEDESIRDAPTDRKVSFLESKGLNSDEIETLLGVARNPEATSSTETPAEDKTQETTSSPASLQSQPTSSSPVTASSTSTSMAQPRSTPATSPSTSPSSARDVPPIITYPEFLFQPAKPPPLVTMSRILYTIYGAAGLGASIYGASEYLVKPMLANLTSARHDLATTAQENLEKLNEKLEQTVTVIPAHLTARKTADEEESNDSDSFTSDPTELFHRDIGTQTTPDVSQTSLVSSTKDSEEDAEDAPTVAVNNHLSRLESIQSQLKEVNELEKDSSDLDDSMRASLTDLHHYLDGLIYSAPAYSASTPSYGLYSNTTSSGGDSKAAGVRKSEDDAIASFKAEIRGVKGALLSARNFPASRGGRLGGVTASPGR
ncbi:hypothetical protein N7462_003138 [Penicillium macrosclerotiorum]|uniref:uncharacterized protein n=1 Tax=Penicillium macrosclerotiorum TaxID=303699 RepID=UPI002547847C|nr:uncharacterized protein N7462_003138 [Penicillium macrosclerotiorum]KAJ5688746.1 hypothetical protein N7462_003138 [Penicillium macrosclerotiorum]